MEEQDGRAGGGNKKRFQYCTDPSGQEIIYLRDLKGHSGRSPIDPTLQDNVFIPNNFFEHIYLVGCAVNLHSKNLGLIAGKQNSSRDRQTVFLHSRESHRFPMLPWFPTPLCLQPLCHLFKFSPRTERIRGTIQVRLSFQIDGFLTDPSQFLDNNTQPSNQTE